ncbi:MAG TPA: hypothetical protein DDY90_00560 [Clostridiales bacterium]|nr:hypothetical protein [Clostridiales bacterium]
MQLRPPGGGEILHKIGGNLRRDEKVAAALVHADIAHRLPADARAHQRPQKVPVAGAVPLKERGAQTHAGAVLAVEAGFVQIVRQEDQHFPFRVLVAAEGVQPLRLAEQEFCHFQLPEGEKAGGGGDVFPHSCVDFIPELRQKQPIFGRLGDFFNVASFHAITKGTIPQLLPGGKNFFLYDGGG